jgi:hypothetical protein
MEQSRKGKYQSFSLNKRSGIALEGLRNAKENVRIVNLLTMV